MIKNAIVFKAELPSIDAVRQHLQEIEWRELNDLEYRRSCFVANETTGDLVTDFPGGFALRLRTDEKIVPPAVVQAETDKQVAEIEERNGEKLPRKSRTAIKEEVFLALCAQALTSTTYTWAFYHAAEQLLIVDTAGKPKADRLAQTLIQLIGSVKTETIHVSDIKHGVTTRLRQLISGDVEAPFGRLGIDDHAQLVRRFDEVEKVTYAGTDVANNHELLEQLEAGYQVEDLGMVLSRMHFRLTSQFRLKSINFSPIEDDESEDADDAAHAWRMTALDEVEQITDVVKELCDLLGYQEEQEQAA
ncbi:recombination-associated protein RdgC [Halomonas organivorans]|uniref:Recombination-associated protein RdgC n=1 Tax=Halomonas organivorans TaxID=257772 RepID=A0A7W5C1U4_9GAMM|nr:recombination-associated protein RdgC [Halomonas organivorans]MBB3142228.1 recombination associated protein RdgC [Halomonas organivorans]